MSASSRRDAERGIRSDCDQEATSPNFAGSTLLQVTSNDSQHFRLDIQGLRGLAVALVIIDHAGWGLTGGYIGVDVFFVISGYVITETLIREIRDTGRISMSNFYSRRVRRLVPASTVVILATLILSLFVLSPGIEHEKAAAAGLASMFFVPNIRYVLEGGYFFLAADPFRHFWSLGVEEQFYLAFPAALLLVFRTADRDFRRFRRLFITVVVGIAIVSFTFASLLSLGFRVFPLPTRLSFFGTPFRMWELLIGSIVSLTATTTQHFRLGSYRHLARLLGLGMIILPAVMYDEFTLFPGISALPPVLGTALLILSGTGESHCVPLLTSRPLTFLGDVSYGLYLWHWPLIVFAQRIWTDNQLSVLLAVVVSVVLSAFQYQYLEMPFRRRSTLRGRSAVALVTVAAVLVSAVSLGLTQISQKGLGLKKAAIFEESPNVGEVCVFGSNWTSIIEKCTFGRASGTRVLLLGDSQAPAMSDGVLSAVDAIEGRVTMIYSNACPVHARPNEIREECAAFQSAFRSIVESVGPEVVIVANAADLYVSRGGLGKPDARIRDRFGRFPNDYWEALSNWTDGVDSVLRSSVLGVARVLYLQMIPPAPESSPTLIKRRIESIDFALKSRFDRNIVVEAERKVLSTNSRIFLLDPAESLCPNGRCPLFVNGKPIYADSFHLNSRGSVLVSAAIQDALIQILEKSN